MRGAGVVDCQVLRNAEMRVEGDAYDALKYVGNNERRRIVPGWGGGGRRREEKGRSKDPSHGKWQQPCQQRVESVVVCRTFGVSGVRETEGERREKRKKMGGKTRNRKM